MPVNPIRPPAPVVAPGIQTTEFWVTMLVVISNVLGSVSGVIPAPYGLIASAIASAAYAVSRALTKSAAQLPV